MLKSITSENPNAIDKVMEIFSQDAYQLTCNGLISNDQSKRVYMVHLSSKGDLPALAKVGGLVRTFSHVPRAGSSRTAANGICHFCLAGQEADSTGRPSIPYEEFLPFAPSGLIRLMKYFHGKTYPQSWKTLFWIETRKLNF